MGGSVKESGFGCNTKLIFWHIPWFGDFRSNNTVKAPVSRHPREAKKVSLIGTVCLWECVNIVGLYRSFKNRNLSRLL